MKDKNRPAESGKICEVCEGSGQVCEFRGVSRFILTWDDCPVCGGMGFVMEPPKDDDALQADKERK